jgi:hypothetical protein
MVQVLHSGVVAVLTTFGDQIAPDPDSAIVVPEPAVYAGDFEEETQPLVWVHLEVSLKCPADVSAVRCCHQPRNRG